MFERETEIIIHAVRRRLPQTGGIAVKDILAADVPYALKTFFRADVEFMLEEELKRHRKSSRFNFEHPEVQSLQQQINSVLVLNYSFDREDFYKRLDDAVHLMINYLIRPQWTLAKVIFEKEQTISSPALTNLLRYFAPYEYLKDIIVRYIHDKRVSSFTEKEFSAFIPRADGEYVRRKTGDELARILTPLYEFIEFPKSTDTYALSSKALMKFFEDKGLSSVVNRLEGEIALGINELSRRAIGDLLEDIRRTSGAFEVELTRSDSERPPANPADKSQPKPSPQTA